MKINKLTGSGEINRLSILIIDDRPVFIKGLSVVLRENWGEDIVLAEISPGDVNSRELPESTPEIVLMSCHGLTYSVLTEKVPEIMGRYGSGKVILYDFPNGNLDVVPKLVKWNVYGYLAYNFDIPDFRRCIEVVLSGGKYISSDLVWENLFSGPAKKRTRHNPAFPNGNNCSQVSCSGDICFGYCPGDEPPRIDHQYIQIQDFQKA